MADKREDILARLKAVFAAIPGIDYVGRNEDAADDDRRPAIFMFDADEMADDNDPPARAPMSPRRIAMTPEVYVIVGGKPEDVGTVVNGFRAAVIKAVLSDAALNTLVGTNGHIRYEGAVTALGKGRQMIAECTLAFTFNYLLRPDLL